MRFSLSFPFASSTALRTMFARAALVLAVALGALSHMPTAAHAATPLKAVIVVGPSHGSTATYLSRGETIAKVAASYGMDVRRVFHPNATWSNVLAHAQGANLLVYLGHGNGWPSPYGSFQTLTKDGMGLNPYAGGKDSEVKYYGEGPIGDSIRLAPNSVVLLNHLCYASGNGESGDPIPTQTVAVQRVDNFGAGFARSGAKATFAYAWQSVSDVIHGLFTTDRSMDAIFMGIGYAGGADVRFNSVRTPGATGHLDKTSAGYRRSVVGDLAYTAAQFRGATAAPATPAPDTTAPVLSAVSAVRSSSLPAASASDPAVFAPNGDGFMDMLAVNYSASEKTSLRVSILDADGARVRYFSKSTLGGAGQFSWDGKGDDGKVVGDGTYTLSISPVDYSGNRGTARVVQAQVMTALATPTVTRRQPFTRDSDALASSTTLRFTVTKPASVTWRIVNRAGETVLMRWTDRATEPGLYGYTWTGTDGDGHHLADGFYYSLVSATTDAGTVTSREGILLSAFKLARSASSGAPGTRVTVAITSAEPLAGTPILSVAQPGLARYTVVATQTGTTTYSAAFTVRSGGSPGTAALTVTGTDTGGQSQSSATTFAVR